MKIFFIIGISLVFLVGLGLIGLSLASRKAPDLGLVDGRLRACPPTPNCVCSEWSGRASSIVPLRFHDDAAMAWSRLKQAIDATGGEITAEQSGYLRARYVTPWLRFVDDVEFRLDPAAQVIHVRSASRVGRSDLGANRKRVEAIRARFEGRG